MVEAASLVAETEELLATAAADPLISGVVGFVDLTASDVGEQIDRLQAAVGGDRLVGIRSPVQAEPDRRWLERRDVVAGLNEVAARNLVYDLLVLPHQIDAAIAAVAQMPEGRFVVDHLAKPAIIEGQWDPWASAMAALAQFENVSCKLSGMVTEADWRAWSVDDLRRYADHVIAVFGPHRLIFGTDWPVCTLAASYQDVVGVAEQLIADLSEAERDADPRREHDTRLPPRSSGSFREGRPDDSSPAPDRALAWPSPPRRSPEAPSSRRSTWIPQGPQTGAVRLTADVTDNEAVVRAVDEAAAAMSGIDVVINNAGIGAQGTVEANTIDEWQRVFDVNVFGMVRVSRAALPYLRRSGCAAIVNTCSIAATAGLPERALYSATKGAVLSLTLAMAADHLREGIRVNCVNPGTADTPWIGRLLAKAADPAAERVALDARQPSGRLVSAAEVADAVLYLASPAASATTGIALAVDGGMQGLRLRPPQ